MNRYQRQAAAELTEKANEAIQTYLTPGAALCWHCRKAYGGRGCPWADALRPNKHWEEIIRGANDNSVLVRKCGDFDFEDDKPLDIVTAKKVMAGTGMCNIHGRALLPSTILDYRPNDAEKLLKKYNGLRQCAGLPPIVILEPDELDEEEGEEE